MPEIGQFDLYKYSPSGAAAIAFIVIFSVLFLAHAFQMFKTRGWYFVAMVLGALMESVGYIGRYLGHNNPTSLGAFILQTILILIAPSLFAGSIYIVLGRTIIALRAEKLSLIRVSRLTAFFVTGDVLSFSIQGAGGGFTSSDDLDRRDLGQKIVLVGLVMQVLWFGGFIIVSAVFHARMRSFNVPPEKAGWTRLMYALYTSSILILVRCVFRLVEFSSGSDGVIMKHEWYIYVFDAVLMTIAVGSFNIVHPPTYILRMSTSRSQITEDSIPLEERVTS